MIISKFNCYFERVAIKVCRDGVFARQKRIREKKHGLVIGVEQAFNGVSSIR